MEQKRRTLQRREALKRHHQRQRYIVGNVFLGLDNGFRQPGAKVGFALVASRFQLVERKACHDAAQERSRLAHPIALGVKPAQERFLNDVLCIGDRAEHPVRNADQFGTQRLEACRGVLVGGEGH